MSSEESAQPSHVSASKKAGRKLKHAKDTSALEDSEDKEVVQKHKKSKDKKKLKEKDRKIISKKHGITRITP